MDENDSFSGGHKNNGAKALLKLALELCFQNIQNISICIKINARVNL